MGSGLLAEGNEVVVRVWKPQEASLRQHWRQKDAAVFGVEPKKCVLGKRGARFFYKRFMKCLMSICLLQRKG